MVGHSLESGIRFAEPAPTSEGSQAGDMTMEMPTPGAAHFKLEKLVGFWRGEERVYPSPWDPRGGDAVGRVRNRIALGGFVLIHDYEQERNGKTALVGLAVLRWDATAERYVLLWFDSMGMPPTEFHGDLEGDVLTLVSQDPQGWIRAVWDFGEEGRYSYLMEASPDGERWEPLMEGEYLREG
jgi:hypothetical protein